MAERETRRGRPAKFSQDEVREIVLERAVNDLLESGVSYGLDSVRLDRILVTAKIPRSSGYAAFSDDESELSPQETLRRAVVIDLLRNTPGGNAAPTREIALEKIDELADVITSGTRQQRRQARTEIIELVATFNHESLNSQRWTVYRSLVIAELTNKEKDQEILDAIEFGEQRLVESYANLFEDFAEVFRMRLRSPFTHKQFAIALYGLNEGLSNHSGAPFRDQAIDLPGSKTASVFTVGVEALFEHFYEFVD